MIKCHDLSISYDKKSILKEVAFTLPDQENLTILGVNGSGKSTLAKALSGLISYEGLIEIEQKNLAALSPLLRAQAITYIPAKLESFDAYTTVEDFVLMGRYAHKKAYQDYSIEDKKIALQAVEHLNIQTLLKNRLQDLSSGQQQLTLIAQALAQQSLILIFDEPTANLDPKNSRFFAQELKKLSLTHQLILITHDISLAAFMQSDVLFVQEGKTTLYPHQDFFKADNLQSLYGVNFEIFEHHIGVCYA